MRSTVATAILIGLKHLYVATQICDSAMPIPLLLPAPSVTAVECSRPIAGTFQWLRGARELSTRSRFEDGTFNIRGDSDYRIHH